MGFLERSPVLPFGVAILALTAAFPAGAVLFGIRGADLLFLGLSGSASGLAALAVLLLFRRRLAPRVDEILEKSPVGIAVAEMATGKILRFNEQFTALYGYTLRDLPDLERWFERVYPDPAYRARLKKDWGELLEESRRTGKAVPSLEVRVTCKDGTVRVVVISTALVGSLAVVTFVDRTAQKQAEEALGEMNRSLEEKVQARTQELEKAYQELVDTEKLAALGQLTTGMAHELGTPLGAIQAANGLHLEYLRGPVHDFLGFLTTLGAEDREFFLELSRRTRTLSESAPPLADRKVRRQILEALETRGLDPDDDLAEYLIELGFSEAEFDALAASPVRWKLLRGCRDIQIQLRMGRIVAEGVGRAAHQVDALRQYVRGRDSEEMALFPVAEQLETLLTLFQHKIKHGVEVVRAYPPDSEILGDRQRLGQVWMNLIHNALQSMEFHGTLRVAVTKTEEALEVRIGDDGPGIPEAIQDKVFTPYFTTKKRGEGLGLGLDLCRKIVQDHRGTIGFSSRPGNTVFTVSLPLAQES